MACVSDRWARSLADGLGSWLQHPNVPPRSWRFRVCRHGVVGPQIPGGIPLLGPAPGVHPVLVGLNPCAPWLLPCALWARWTRRGCHLDAPHSGAALETSYVEVGSGATTPGVLRAGLVSESHSGQRPLWRSCACHHLFGSECRFNPGAGNLRGWSSVPCHQR